MESDEHTRQRAAVDSGDPMVGRVLDGRYRIERRVARGGMASVYEAVDLRLERVVAVKVMHAGLGDDDEFAARFVREARAAAKLSHPHVVAVHDQGQDEGVVFLVMEYVPGRTLRDVVRESAPLPPARALALVEPVLAALGAAHRAGLVHRDVKPENVLVGEVGDATTVKVADFGLAKAVSATSNHTATGVVIGTVSYLAPEVVVQGQADARADVYAVGVLLYELLTGHKPHDGESQIQVAYKHVHEDVPAPSTAVPGIPAYVDALVARATARDRDQRPADAGVLLHQVRRVAQTLRDGLHSDPELEADLRPTPLPSPLPVEVLAEDEGLTAVAEAPTVTSAPSPTGAPAPSDHTQQIQLSDLPPSPAPPQVGPSAKGQRIRRLPTPTSDASRSSARSRRGPLTLLLALLLVVALGVGAWWFGFARYTTTPSVLGLTETEAVAVLEKAGLEAEVGSPSFHESIPVGEVVTTDPGPGDRVLPDNAVVLSLSRGPERYDVPTLRGLSDDEARASLEETKLTVGRVIERWHEKVPEGEVVSSDPKAGTTLRPGAAVDVVLSKGRRPITLEDWTGKRADRAESTLEKAGLVVKVEEVFDDEVAEGVVKSQSPRSGTLYKGDEVTLTVSQGPELVEVPRLQGQGVAKATETLKALGFEVETKRAAIHLGLGFVASSDPPPGTMAKKGSTIVLSLV